MMNRKLAKRILRRGESGIALISVLLLIATGSLLALMVMSIRSEEHTSELQSQ